ncbi:unnamed protein product [Caenorhabditis angaria]|uniref:ShKT domain-containing protein n=1 Tax=Caenorhabditis angaria TaxID=860376 RepID=A0A9P1MWL7_9PELO|nr:unnamed protein product [Caenorhabditis angaria]
MQLTSVVLIVFTIFVGIECCTDSASACASWKNNGFCTNSFYTNTQRAAYCAKSCGLCSDTTTASSGCTDSSANCAGWKANGFCDSTHYTDAVKTQYCASTCSKCDSTGTTAAGEETTTGG